MSEGVDLEVVLKAKGVEVAISRDASIWLTAMGLISGASPVTPSASKPATFQSADDEPEQASGDLIAKFADEIGVKREQLEGAAGPSHESPFIHLDHKYWAALKSTPGTKAVAPVILAGTLLLLWDRHAKIGDVTLGTCGAVLKTIDLTTASATRAFKRCDWIQLRGNALKLNPALIGKAEDLARKYCAARGG